MNLEQIPEAVYQAISFQVGETPKLSDLGQQFISRGLLINNTGNTPLIKSLPDYIEMMNDHISAGTIISISEREISQKVTVVGKVAQIYSEYELEFTAEHTPSQTRQGVNLFQLVYQNDSWKISSMCWDDQSGQPLLGLIA